MTPEQQEKMKIAVVMTALYIILIFALIGLAFVVYQFIKWWSGIP